MGEIVQQISAIIAAATLAILGIFGEEKTGENFESKAILVACHKGRCLRTPWLLKVQIHSDRTATVVQVAVDLHERRCDRKGFTMKIRLQNNIHQKSHGFLSQRSFKSQRKKLGEFPSFLFSSSMIPMEIERTGW
jgi:hypothetical protein